MQRQLPTRFGEPTASLYETPGRSVPQEHNFAADRDPQPGAWSLLGRRVLAEAWRRLTAEHARPSSGAIPAVPAPADAEIES